VSACSQGRPRIETYGWRKSAGDFFYRFTRGSGRLSEESAASKTYCDEVKGQINELAATELASHLQGQIVAMHAAYDELFDASACRSRLSDLQHSPSDVPHRADGVCGGTTAPNLAGPHPERGLGVAGVPSSLALAAAGAFHSPRSMDSSSSFSSASIFMELLTEVLLRGLRTRDDGLQEDRVLTIAIATTAARRPARGCGLPEFWLELIANLHEVWILEEILFFGYRLPVSRFTT
jgi:hypothetical protein